MKRTEEQLDELLEAVTIDGRVHVVHGGRDERYTAAYILTESGDGLLVHAAIAACNPRDNFCRKIGRMISKGRLLSRKNVISLEHSFVPKNAKDWRVLDRMIVNTLLFRSHHGQG